MRWPSTRASSFDGRTDDCLAAMCSAFHSFNQRTTGRRTGDLKIPPCPSGPAIAVVRKERTMCPPLQLSPHQHVAARSFRGESACPPFVRSRQADNIPEVVRPCFSKETGQLHHFGADLSASCPPLLARGIPHHRDQYPDVSTVNALALASSTKANTGNTCPVAATYSGNR